MTDLEQRKIAFCDAIITLCIENEGDGISDVEFMDLAEEHGVIRGVPYDPKKHGDVDAAPGDAIFVRTS